MKKAVIGALLYLCLTTDLSKHIDGFVGDFYSAVFGYISDNALSKYVLFK